MSTARPDYYAVLGVSKDADAAEIKKKFRRLARECHPDVAGDDPKAAARFTQLREAYETLIDPEARHRYDNPPKRRTFTRTAWRPPGGNRFGEMGGGNSGYRASRQRWRDPANSLDLDDIFSQTRGKESRNPRPRSGRPPQGDFTAGGATINAGPPPGSSTAAAGEDVTLSVDVSGRIARLGGTVTLNYPRRKRSERGNNLFRYNEIFDLRITPDTRDGESIRIPRMGHAGPGGGTYGDLVCTLSVRDEPGQDERGQREAAPRRDVGTDIDLPISLTEALLGGRVEVNIPSGRVRLTVPPCTSSGTRLRLRGRGSGGEDLYVRLRIVVPDRLDDESRRLIEQFAELNPDSPRE